MIAADPMGRFVMVGGTVGVIVGTPGFNGVPAEHYAIWHGAFSPANPLVPVTRLVPIEYCKAVEPTEAFH